MSVWPKKTVENIPPKWACLETSLPFHKLIFVHFRRVGPMVFHFWSPKVGIQNDTSKFTETFSNVLGEKFSLPVRKKHVLLKF